MPAQPRILMVEDHPDIADLYQLKLQLEGYRVAVAADGVSGLAMARSLKPDVTLLDVHLPYLNGLEVLATLREDEATRDLLVVVFSEDDSPKLIEEARRLNAAAYLLKTNLLPSRLSDTVGDVLRDRARLAVSGNGNGQSARQAS